MNFGAVPALMPLLYIAVVWGIPLLLLVWFIRTVTAIARRLGDIVVRLESLERAIRDTAGPVPPEKR